MMGGITKTDWQSMINLMISNACQMVYVCVGQSGDTSSTVAQIICLKLDGSGKLLMKKLYSHQENQYGYSLAIKKNGDFIIGGNRVSGPLLMQTDSLGNIKWSTWFYDSVAYKLRLQNTATINSLRETSRGTIICAAGDPYPNNNGQVLNNYAAILEFDSLGHSPYIPGEASYVSEFKDDVGYNIGGFYIDETKGKNFVLSGNQSVYYTDSLGNPQWKKNYTFMLSGVGSETNKISRAKVLRDNNLIVAGQAYEGNCWTKYKTLYYDAWWSPVNYGSGLNTNWDTAGRQGRTDYLYDFTQLNNGNLVFVGTKANTTSDSGGIWTFVTDSIGKQLYYEKQTKVPYKTTNGFGVIPYSVCATPDGGFTVAGVDECVDSLGGENAFAAHFIPKPVSSVMYRGNFQAKSLNGFSIRLVGAKLIVLNTMSKVPATVSLFDVSGRCVATQTVRSKGSSPLSFDISHLAHGTYIVRAKAGTMIQSIKVVN
jgi:hypothetical protein